MQPNEILRNSLKELIAKRDELKAELESYENAIIPLEGILLDSEEASRPIPAEKVIADIPYKIKTTATTRKKPSPPIKESDVRNAIISIVKEPFPPLAPAHKLKDGFFTSRQLAEVIGCHAANSRINIFIKKFVEKGILESQTYKAGKQYRYIPPSAAVSPADIVRKDGSFPPAQNGRRNGGAIPGTGRNDLHTSDKDVEKMLRAARNQGFSVKRTGSDHIQVSSAQNGKSTVVSGTHTGSARRVKEDWLHIVARNCRILLI